jgi:hypothetical protein
MDERLEKALEFSNYLVTLENSKRILKEQYQESLIYFHNKGQFTVTMQLISFLQSLLQLKQTETVLIDDNDIPIEIQDLKKFVIEVMNIYFHANNKYLIEYNKLVNQRSTKDLIDL